MWPESMLIDGKRVKSALLNRDIQPTGILHIGAHECEELGFYQSLGLRPTDVIWIDAISSKVEEAKRRGIPNVYNAVITGEDGKEVDFYVSNNVQSSSILPLGTHKTEHPNVWYVRQNRMTGVTIDTFFEKSGHDVNKCNLWNLDIQGAELMALQGAERSLKSADALYLEVNEASLYEGCGLIGEIDDFLKTKGFERVITSITRHKWGDALYCRTRHS